MLLLGGFLAGCTTVGLPTPDPAPPGTPAGAGPPGKTGAIQHAVCRAETPAPSRPEASLPPPRAVDPSPAPSSDSSAPFKDQQTLSVDAVVREVLARNPTLAQMVAAWEAAQARYPQAISLDDPTFTLTLGPQTYFSDRVNPAYRINLGQKYPWPGKLELRGQQAKAEARAAGNEVDDVRLRLVESARTAFYDYYLVYRAVEVNREGVRLVQEFKKNAEARYKTGGGQQNDINLADVELGRLQERALLLEQNRQVAVARINTLLNLPPDYPLPPPPAQVAVEDGLPPAEAIRAAALARRPDLMELANRIDADQAALALAHKEFYPDFTPFVMYDRFMGNNFQSRPLALMVGVGLNLPVRQSRRYAAVAEAQARLNERRAELQERVNRVNFEVQQAHAQVERGRKSVRLYEQTVLPAARRNVSSAQTAYVAGKIPFLTLIEAQREVVGLRDRYYQLVADYHRRLAVLERVAGGPLAAAAAPGQPGVLSPACGGPAAAGRDEPRSTTSR